MPIPFRTIVTCKAVSSYFVPIAVVPTKALIGLSERNSLNETEGLLGFYLLSFVQCSCAMFCWRVTTALMG
jgi:hypothetical protein